MQVGMREGDSGRPYAIELLLDEHGALVVQVCSRIHSGTVSQIGRYTYAGEQTLTAQQSVAVAVAILKLAAPERLAAPAATATYL